MKKLIIILGALGASVSAPLFRLSSAPSMIVVLYRVVIAALLMVPAALGFRRDELKALHKKDLLLCLLSGLFLGLHFTCYFESLKFTSISSSVVLVDTEVFFVAFMLLFIFHEKIPGKAWIGIVLAFIGSVVIAMTDAGSGPDVLKGDLLALSGALFMAIYTMIGRSVRTRVSTTTYTFFVYLSAALTVLLIVLFSKTPVTGYAPVNWLVALGMAVFCTLLGHSVFSWGLKYESAAFISAAKLLEPVFASILGILLFREIPKLSVVIGGLIVIAGLYVYTRFSSGSPAGSGRCRERNHSCNITENPLQ
ncbi:MAG: DMT family transporter [Lachnospiraceae bacterium]|nr:DMT family transporter [Lachnospiraceae bacterium]